VLDLGAGNVSEAGFRPVTFTGFTALNVNAAGAGVALFGTAGPDNLTFTPTGARSATVTVAGPGLRVNLSNVAAGFTIDPRGGGDTIDVVGTTGRDTIKAASVGPAPGLPTVTVAALLPLTFSVSDTEALVIDDGGGSDDVTVDSSANPFPVPITVLADQSSLTLTGGTATPDAYTPGPTAGPGTRTLIIGGAAPARRPAR